MEMPNPAVILVGADKGGVGKTTVTRTLIEYFGVHNVSTRAFDTESPRGTLKRFHPTITEIVDITSTADQIRVFDTINVSQAQVTVVDIRAGLLLPTLQVLRDIGFLEAAKEGQLTFGVFHILGPSIASLNEISEIAPYITDASYFPIKNFINNTTFFDWDPTTYNSYFKKVKGSYELAIPHLVEMACEQVELASVPFVTFIANKTATGETASYSFVLRGYVRHWLGQVWGEYDRLQLNQLMGVEPRSNGKTARSPKRAIQTDQADG